MKKTAYILGSVEVMLGVLLCCITSIIKKVLPVLGRVAYQAAAAGSYDPSNYDVSFTGVTFASIILIIAGIAQICYFAFSKRDRAK